MQVASPVLVLTLCAPHVEMVVLASLKATVPPGEPAPGLVTLTVAV